MLYLFAALLSITVRSQIPCTVESDCDAYGTDWTCDGSVCTYSPTTCTSDDQCTGATPICSTTVQSCIACRVTEDCTSNTENYGSGFICIAGGGVGACLPDDTTTDTTTTDTCLSNTDCPTELPFCDTSTKQCGVCLIDADCASNDDCIALSTTGTCTCDELSVGGLYNTKYCNPSTSTATCDTDGDCSEFAPYCDPTLSICQSTVTNGCAGDEDCPNALPTCVIQQGVCVNEDQSNTCETAAKCYGTWPLCNADTGRCYACDTDTDCENNILYGSRATCEWITESGITVSICCPEGDDECGDGSTTIATKIPTPSPTGLYVSLPPGDSFTTDPTYSSVERYGMFVANVIILIMISWM